ncbi:hypothetical protein [Herpetosiphon geysericola]|nr:hypothetical protein [Herpetosiphon geysericola]
MLSLPTPMPLLQAPKTGEQRLATRRFSFDMKLKRPPIHGTLAF